MTACLSFLKLGTDITKTMYLTCDTQALIDEKLVNIEQYSHLGVEDICNELHKNHGFEFTNNLTESLVYFVDISRSLVTVSWGLIDIY